MPKGKNLTNCIRYYYTFFSFNFWQPHIIYVKGMGFSVLFKSYFITCVFILIFNLASRNKVVWKQVKGCVNRAKRFGKKNFVGWLLLTSSCLNVAILTWGATNTWKTDSFQLFMKRHSTLICAVVSTCIGAPRVLVAMAPVIL